MKHARILPRFAMALACAGSTAWAQTTTRVSLSSSGAQSSSAFTSGVSISSDGRYVAFASTGTTLVAGDTNGSMDVFVRDRQTGTTERVSVTTGGGQGNFTSDSPSISADGRYVAFHSLASNLVSGDTNLLDDVFVRDRTAGTTERVSVDSSAAQVMGISTSPSISGDGRYVAFDSTAQTLVGGDTNSVGDIFVRDRTAGTTERVSVDSGGAEGDDGSFTCSISADGQIVAFMSRATNLVAGDTNALQDTFVRDRQTGVTERVSVDSGGVEGNGDSQWQWSRSLSSDGRYVAFYSSASNLVGGDANGSLDVFVRDRIAGTTERVSVATGGTEGNGSSLYPSLSDDGGEVAFWSSASSLVSGDTNGFTDVFVHDRIAATTERASVNWAAAQGSSGSSYCSLSADGRYVAFWSNASNLVPVDTNGTTDLFVRDRQGAPAFTSLCDPGVGGVVACPCANPPSGLGRGCDNSAATGGAILSASGATCLSSDSLVFTTSGQRPTALSILLQGTATAPNGLVYGQGVRCVVGALKRLFSKSASGGSITAPDFGAGDPSVSGRSAALGNPIAAGQSRWYLVFYRDPIVLGGCPATSTFNATQTGEVAWSP